jgi:phosphate transport system permease protein
MNDTTKAKNRAAKRLNNRHRAEWRFRFIGFAAVSIGLICLASIFVIIIVTGLDAFRQTKIALEIDLPIETFHHEKRGDTRSPGKINYQAIVKQALRNTFPDIQSRRDKRALYRLVSSGAAFELRGHVERIPALIGKRITLWVTASDDVDMVIKGKVPRTAPESHRRLSDDQMGWLAILEDAGRVEARFNDVFFTGGDSREAELAGIAGAALGSLYTIFVCLALAFPLGVMTAVYLEEFAPKNFWTTLIEVNINNLAAVPSIVFGLLGLAVFLNIFQLPRSSPLVGGMVLALMTLPTVIIAGRAAIKAAPPSIREAALALGASPLQAVFHHVLPLAMPGIITGGIIGTSRALGETAPLLMIGMVAFVVDLPSSVLDAATALPVQIFLWADMPERAFGERTAAAILVLLTFTCLMNLTATILRKKYEIRW